ncbi:MAG: phosphotyrosine protein phosphatase [Planctomycetota bacterium]|nr:phosphotyrosine protein phosphatase [Planctomycetota bacterium]
MPEKLLFVCRRNQWRSPTAEKVYARDPRFDVRSAGLSSSAVRRLTAKDVAWAERIFVMESEHKSQLQAAFRDELGRRPVHVLKIPDEHGFMDPELVEPIRAGVEVAAG